MSDIMLDILKERAKLSALFAGGFMSVYERPTKDLMREFAANLKPGELFRPQDAVAWFVQHYPKLQSSTVSLHVAGMAVNNVASRRHSPNIKPGSGYDLFFKVGPAQYRLWNPETDPPPQYASSVLAQQSPSAAGVPLDADETEAEDEAASGQSEFAFERDLKNYLAKNLAAIEPGLRLYQDGEFTGIEYPVGGRFIDILAVDAQGGLVVVELKVSRGYERVIGQLLRYVAWVKQNIANGRSVRGIIIAREISADLRLACSLIQNVRLVEYAITFALKEVSAA